MRTTILGNKLALVMQALFLTFGFGAASVVATMVVAPTVLAAAPDCNPDTTTNPIANGASCAQAAGTSSNLFAPGGVFQTIADTMIFVIGAVAVIFLIIGGLRYVISNGDPKNVTAAKDTILYAIVGIVVAIISFAVVSFVITQIGKAS
jgi:type IV secretion system pilin